MTMKVVGLDEKRVELVHKYKWPGLLALVITAAIIAAIVCAIIIPDWDNDDFSYDHLFHHRHHHQQQQAQQLQQAQTNHLANMVINAVDRLNDLENGVLSGNQGRGAGDGPIREGDDEELVEDKVIENKEYIEDINVNVNLVNGPPTSSPSKGKSSTPAPASKPAKVVKTLEGGAANELSQKAEVELLPIPTDAEIRAALSGLAIPGDYEEFAAEPVFHLRPLESRAHVVGQLPMHMFAPPRDMVGQPPKMARFYPGRTRVLSDPERVEIERLLHPMPRTMDDIMVNPLLMRSSMDPFGLIPEPEGFNYQDESIDLLGPGIGHPSFSGPFASEPVRKQAPTPAPTPALLNAQLDDVIKTFEHLFGPLDESDSKHNGGFSMTMFTGHMAMSDAEFERTLNEADAELAKLAHLQEESKSMMDNIGQLVKHERQDERLLQAKMSTNDPKVLKKIPAEITLDHVMQEERVAENLMKEEDKRAKMVEAQQLKSDSLLNKIGQIAHAKAVEPPVTMMPFGHPYDRQSGIEPALEPMEPIDIDRLVPDEYLEDDYMLNGNFPFLPFFSPATVKEMDEKRAAANANGPDGRPTSGRITLLLRPPQVLPPTGESRPLLPPTAVHEIPFPPVNMQSQFDESGPEPNFMFRPLHQLPGPFHMMPPFLQMLQGFMPPPPPPSTEQHNDTLVVPKPKPNEVPPKVQPSPPMPKVDPLRRPSAPPPHAAETLFFPSLFDPLPVINNKPSGPLEKPADLAGNDHVPLFKSLPEFHHPSHLADLPQAKSPPVADPHKVGKRVLPDQAPLSSPPTVKLPPSPPVMNIPPSLPVAAPVARMQEEKSPLTIRGQSGKPSLLQHLFGGLFDDDY